MTPKISTFLSLAEDSGAALQINSNATLMRDNETLRRLLSGASVIKFSVDGARRATYESIRVGSDFELVLKNIRMVVQIRNELPRAIRPRLAVYGDDASKHWRVGGNGRFMSWALTAWSWLI